MKSPTVRCNKLALVLFVLLRNSMAETACNSEACLGVGWSSHQSEFINLTPSQPPAVSPNLPVPGERESAVEMGRAQSGGIVRENLTEEEKQEIPLKTYDHTTSSEGARVESPPRAPK